MADEPPPVRLGSDRTASWEWESIPRDMPRPKYRQRGRRLGGQLARRLSPHPDISCGDAVAIDFDGDAKQPDCSADACCNIRPSRAKSP